MRFRDRLPQLIVYGFLLFSIGLVLGTSLSPRAFLSGLMMGVALIVILWSVFSSDPD